MRHGSSTFDAELCVATRVDSVGTSPCNTLSRIRYMRRNDKIMRQYGSIASTFDACIMRCDARSVRRNIKG
jgi:hypothetical protein